VSDRPSGGKTDLNQLFLISPMDGTPNVSWRRNRIEVRPRKGFRANTAYSVTLLPGLTDMRGNARTEPFTIVFSTGREFPRLGVSGRVFEWALERPAPGAYVEALSLPDSVRYVAMADSTGQFNVGPFGPGTYLVRATIDKNNNRGVDRGEQWDSVRVPLTTNRIFLEMLAIERDSDLVFVDVASPDSVTLDITFDKYLSPRQELRPALIRVQRSDSSQMQVAQIQSGQQMDRAIADSVRRADSLRTDSLRAAGVRPPAGQPAVGPRPAGPPPPKPSQPPPSKKLRVTLSPANPLVVGQTYRLSTVGLENLVGRTRDVTRSFTVPRRGPPADSAGRPLGTPPPTRPPPRPPR